MKLLLLALFWSSVAAVAASAPCNKHAHDPKLDYLTEISNWIMTLNLASNNISIHTKIPKDSIFINGNLARVLTATYRLTCNETYLNEALHWCDTLVRLQNSITSSRHVPAGFWGTGYGTHPDHGDIYLADTGTATTQLAFCHSMATPGSAQQKQYLHTMELYAEFVQFGCLTPPPGRTQASPGWVITTGKNAGALGNGYIGKIANQYPYVVSSSTTGGAYFSELYEITQNPVYKEIAENATRWLLSIRYKNGSMPYIYDNGIRSFADNKFRVLAYATEPFVDVGLRFKDMRITLGALNTTIDYLLETQNPDGTWGKLLSANAVRSPRVVTLLQWYYQYIKQDDRVREAMDRFFKFFLVPANSKKYQVLEDPITGGFVGLALADYLGPWSSWPMMS